ncbi:MAG TPA: hypothetical protein VKK31_23060 [Thermoanaerobaculia bacterium]|nr:hypothetical protein [Thermoanaerobaculia bacterium]
MTEGTENAGAEAAARAELLKIVKEVESIVQRLKAVHASLPVPVNKGLMPAGENEMDAATEIRSVIECVLTDSLGPAARDLRAAAEYLPAAVSER